MTPYVVVTALSCFLAYMDSNAEIKNRRIRMYAFFCITVMCTLAGARDVTVGTDTSVYGEELFIWVHNHGIKEMIAMNSRIAVEPGYMLLVYLISRVTGEVFWQYFIFQFVCIFFVYKSLDYAQLGKYKWVGVFLYNTLFFSFTLNLMRQTMAMAIVLYGFKYVKKHKPVKYLLMVICAMLMHRTALLSVAIYPMYVMSGMVDREKRALMGNTFRKYKNILVSLLVVASIFILFFAKTLIKLLAFIKPSYKYQVSHIKSYNPSVLMFILMLAFIIPFIMMRIWKQKSEPKLIFYLLIISVSTILWQLQGISSEVYRVTLYFWMLIVIIIPDFIKGLKSVRNRLFFLSYYLILGIVYYVFVFVIRLTNETYPYTSKLLSIL